MSLVCSLLTNGSSRINTGAKNFLLRGGMRKISEFKTSRKAKLPRYFAFFSSKQSLKSLCNAATSIAACLLPSEADEGAWQLVMPGALANALDEHLFPGDDDEHGAVVSAGIVRSQRGVRLLARELFPAEWEARKHPDSSKGHALDHFALVQRD